MNQSAAMVEMLFKTILTECSSGGLETIGILMNAIHSLEVHLVQVLWVI